jgi:hypothetical protein
MTRFLARVHAVAGSTRCLPFHEHHSGRPCSCTASRRAARSSGVKAASRRLHVARAGNGPAWRSLHRVAGLRKRRDGAGRRLRRECSIAPHSAEAAGGTLPFGESAKAERRVTPRPAEWPEGQEGGLQGTGFPPRGSPSSHVPSLSSCAVHCRDARRRQGKGRRVVWVGPAG